MILLYRKNLKKSSRKYEISTKCCIISAWEIKNNKKEKRIMPKPVSSVYGKIKRMLLTFPHIKTFINDIALQRYEGIFKALNKEVEYIILAHKDVHEAIRETAKKANLPGENLKLIEPEIDPDKNFILIQAFGKYQGKVAEILGQVVGDVYVCDLGSPSWHTIWAQDGYCCIKEDNGTTVLLEPPTFKRGGDHKVADKVATKFRDSIKKRNTKYYIEGGNILAGDNYILVGKDYLELNKMKTGKNEEELTADFKDIFGVEHVIWVGLDEPVDFPINVFQGKYQPIFHIDMYITLGGKWKNNKEDKESKSNNKKELVFVADAKSAKEIIRKKSPDEPFPPDEIIEAFNETANWLAKYKKDDLEFEVKRLPIDLWRIDDTQSKFLTYNNCLVEVIGDEKNVYLPKYSSPAPGSINRCSLDEEVARIFREDCRFDNVFQLEGAYEELCKRGGSLHCITKVLDRD
jgi:agmatine/peptidylarginine deiminase